ncbi:MAG: hypothetical protein Q8933_00565 [Bacteroidota bacterium]|nr:hypothetical protein [Bacteroidota bacterium]MDP4190594.1 hypothetical protein [Bacteroidota bacterium]MDP4195424.1 hypothetical protein [Bacteroidota bacterium]
MYGINQTGIELYGDFSHLCNLLIRNNYRYKILEALRENLLGIRIEDGFPIDIEGVFFADESFRLLNKQISIYSVRDVAVMEYQGTNINRNSSLIRNQTKLRNLYVLFKLFLKSENCFAPSKEDIQFRECYIDEIIKCLYGYSSKASQLKDLLYNGIQNDFGLIAYEITETKPYNLKGDLIARFEVLFQYKEKYY